MSKAVENHVAEHKKNLKGNKDADAEVEHIRDDLIAQVLSKACDHNSLS
jgi:hypothetical protein